jgi:acyl dehydratase
MAEDLPDLEWLPGNDVPQIYARISHDHSAIHLDEGVAHDNDLPGVILHGMYIFGRIASHLDQHGRSPHTLYMRFSDITFPDRCIRVGFEPTDTGAALHGEQSGRRTVSAGQATWATPTSTPPGQPTPG